MDKIKYINQLNNYQIIKMHNYIFNSNIRKITKEEYDPDINYYLYFYARHNNKLNRFYYHDINAGICENHDNKIYKKRLIKYMLNLFGIEYLLDYIKYIPKDFFTLYINKEECCDDCMHIESNLCSSCRRRKNYEPDYDRYEKY